MFQKTFWYNLESLSLPSKHVVDLKAQCNFKVQIYTSGCNNYTQQIEIDVCVCEREVFTCWAGRVGRALCCRAAGFLICCGGAWAWPGQEQRRG